MGRVEFLPSEHVLDLILLAREVGAQRLDGNSKHIPQFGRPLDRMQARIGVAETLEIAIGCVVLQRGESVRVTDQSGMLDAPVSERIVRVLGLIKGSSHCDEALRELGQEFFQWHRSGRGTGGYVIDTAGALWALYCEPTTLPPLEKE